MALNTFNCNYLTPLHFERLTDIKMRYHQLKHVYVLTTRSMMRSTNVFSWQYADTVQNAKCDKCWKRQKSPLFQVELEKNGWSRWHALVLGCPAEHWTIQP